LKENYDEFENIDNFDEDKIWKEDILFYLILNLV
jgi:hypothetical protein